MLKMLHMERSKYITANGFFAINYTTMFNVSVSIPHEEID